MTLSQKSIDEYKKIYKNKYHKDITDEEAKDQGERLNRVFDLIFDLSIKELQREKRLKKEPKGFHLDASEGTYSCIICSESITGLQTWWDKNGTKCMDCQRNIEENVIPSEICRNRDMGLRDWQIQSDYGLHSATVRKLKRLGELHGRELKRKDGSIYYTVYLVSENKGFLKKYPKKPAMKVEYVDPKGRKVEL